MKRIGMMAVMVAIVSILAQSSLFAMKITERLTIPEDVFLKISELHPGVGDIERRVSQSFMVMASVGIAADRKMVAEHLLDSLKEADKSAAPVGNMLSDLQKMVPTESAVASEAAFDLGSRLYQAGSSLLLISGLAEGLAKKEVNAEVKNILGQVSASAMDLKAKLEGEKFGSKALELSKEFKP